MKKTIIAAAVLLLSSVAALAQSSPGLQFGQVPTAAQWNSYFAAKADYLGSAACATAGCTMTGKLVTAVPTLSSAGFQFQIGVAPTSPLNGDAWMTSAGFFIRSNGSTIGPIGGGTFTQPQVINLNAASLPTAQTGTALQIGQADGVTTRIELDAFAAVPRFSCVREDGTAASPTTLQANDEICSLNAFGYNGSAIVGPQAAIRSYASQNWVASSAYGTYLRFSVTANGGTTLTDALGIEQDGGITVGSAIGTSEGAGTLNLAGGLYNNGTAPTGTGAYVRAASPTLSGTPVFPTNNFIAYGSIAQLAATSLLGNPTGSLANLEGITLDGTLGFSGTTLKCTTATISQIGCVEPDNVTITISGGVISAVAGAVSSVTCNGLTITSTGTCPEPFSFENCTLAASVGSNILTVALKNNAGSDPSSTSPCRIAFRNATATTGSLVLDSVTGALSITTNATGATLGSVNNTAFRFWVIAFDNGGTVVLALYNASTATTCQGIDEGTVQSSTGISGSATSAGVFYTPNGTSLSSKAIKILGYVEYNSTGLSTAGTYASAPNFIVSASPTSPRPCQVIGIQQASGTPSTSYTDTSYAVRTPTVSITPHSAANLILANLSGNNQANTTSVNARARMSRGNSNNTGLFGSEGLCLATAGSNTCPVSVTGIDAPNTNSSQTYSPQTKEDSSGTGVWGEGGVTIFTLQEIMG
jgi:hypothetical protein